MTYNGTLEMVREMIKSGLSASELLIKFNGNNQRIKGNGKRFLNYQLFLCAATELNHVELVTLLLAERQCDLNNSLKDVPRPLYIAIGSGNVVLVQLFLRSCASLQLCKEYATRLSFDNNNNDIESKTYVILSAVQHACLCKQHDVLKLLVAYEITQQSVPRRISERVFGEDNITPLHAVVRLLRNDGFRKMLSLNTVAQLILEAGVYVNALSSWGFTALNLLILEIKCIVTRHVELSTEERCMIVDTLRVLLAAGSHTTGAHRVDNNPTDLLLQLTFKFSSQLFNHPSLDFCKNYLTMISEMINQLLQHGAKLIDNLYVGNELRPFDKILIKAASYMILPSGAVLENYKNDREQIIMENFSNLFHYFLLSDSSRPTDDLGSKYYCGEWFTIAFICIAGYSCQPGRSQRFIHLMISRMTASQLNAFKLHMLSLETHVIENMEVYLQYIQWALEKLEEFEVPWSLKHLSRCAITRATSYRCLSDVEMSTLSSRIPPSLQKYTLLRDE